MLPRLIARRYPETVPHARGIQWPSPVHTTAHMWCGCAQKTVLIGKTVGPLGVVAPGPLLLLCASMPAQDRDPVQRRRSQQLGNRRRTTSRHGTSRRPLDFTLPCPILPPPDTHNGRTETGGRVLVLTCPPPRAQAPERVCTTRPPSLIGCLPLNEQLHACCCCCSAFCRTNTLNRAAALPAVGSRTDLTLQLCAVKIGRPLDHGRYQGGHVLEAVQTPECGYVSAILGDVRSTVEMTQEGPPAGRIP